MLSQGWEELESAITYPKPLQSIELAVTGMRNDHPNYQSARKQLILFLESEGFKVHPEEVYCPNQEHCRVDVAALKDEDFWAFEYKSRNDSIKRGLAQWRSYSKAFNYVVLVVNRNRATSSPYFSNFKRDGFGVWSHTVTGFHSLLRPERRTVVKRSRAVVERQFRHMLRDGRQNLDRKISEWFQLSPGDNYGSLREVFTSSSADSSIEL